MKMGGGKLGTAFWCAVAACLLLAYALTFGPACWISERTGIGSRAISVLYSPIVRAAEAGPQRAGQIIYWYASLGARPERFVSLRNGVIEWDWRINPDLELGPR
jgi:hypothetical protein